MFETLNKNPVATVFIAVLLMLSIAYVFEYGFGYLPCELCWWQRYPYFLIIALTGIALLMRDGNMVRPLFALAFLALLVEVGIAGFHVGVEYQWWEGLSSCAAAGPTDVDSLSIDALRSGNVARPVRCDAPSWTLFGISMAGYNFVIASALAVFAGLALKNKRV